MHTGLFAYGTLLQGNWYTPWLATPMKYRYSYNIVWQGLNFLTALWVLFTKILVNIISADSKLSQWEALTTKFALRWMGVLHWGNVTRKNTRDNTSLHHFEVCSGSFEVYTIRKTKPFFVLIREELTAKSSVLRMLSRGIFLSSHQISCLNQS